MRKRAHALLLSVCLALSLAVPAQAANTELEIKAPDKLPDVGETFSVTVDVSDNSGFAALELTLGYDKSVVKCLSAYTGTALSSAASAVNTAAEEGVIVVAASARNMTADGTLATYVFQVVDEGDADFELDRIFMETEVGKKVSYSVAESGETTSKPVKPPVVEEEVEDLEPGEAEKKEESAEEARFTDTAGHPSEAYIYAAVDRGFFQGYADGSFKPDGKVTRGAFVTVLWRMAGRPEPTVTVPFTDLGNVSEEFQKAIAWAYGKGYINGRTTTTFAPGDPMSRQATMKIIFNHYGGGVGEELMYYGIYNDNFTDSANMSDEFKRAMYWGIYNDLIDGTTATTLGGPTEANRALLATILVKYTELFGA